MDIITRRTFLGTSSAAALGAALAAGAQGNEGGGQTSKPNILFLMSDQHRGDCVHADGNEAIHTPTMDWLAQEGARFSCAYSSTPSCTPARAALLTGMSPWNHGMLGYSKVAEEYPVELPRVMRDAGYYTLGIGKMHWSPQRNLHGFHRTILDESGREQSIDFRSDYRSWFATVAPNLDPDETGIGWNSYRAGKYKLPEELHPTHWTADVASEFIRTYEQPEPFFLKVSFARPHSPYDPPDRWWDRYNDADLPKRYIGDWAGRYRERSGDSYNIWHGDLGEAQARRSRQGYYGSVSFVDEQMGRVIEALEERGMLENTLILYTSDHGDMTGDHHMWRKCYAYEPSARVPMHIRWPEGMVGEKRGQIIDNPVEIRDILPTFADAVGTEVEGIDGRSMLDLCAGKDAGWRDYIDLEHDVCYSKANHWSAVTDGKWKYIFHAQDGEEQLFDLKDDPGEERDLAKRSEHTNQLQEWRGRMIAELEPRGDAWVKNGHLALRPESIRHSPNYPGSNS